MPLNLRHFEIDTGIVNITWDPPQMEKRNGIITKYIIQLNSQQNTSAELWIVLDELKPYRSYTVAIAAFTISKGPFSELYISHQ